MCFCLKYLEMVNGRHQSIYDDLLSHLIVCALDKTELPELN